MAPLAGAKLSPVERLTDWLRRQTAEAWVTAALVAFSVLFVFLQLQPHLIFANTTPAGGDMGAHVWAPDFLHHELLPRWRLSGWTPDWYDGFPAFQFYMVIPSLLIVLLDVFLFLPYGIAFKLVTVSGLLAMPVAAWFMGRLARLPYPAPAALAVATVPYIFDRSFTIYGGNAASTLAGEFAFTISLVFALLFIGVVLRGIETGRHRAWAAVLLALTVTCHLIPAIFAVIAALAALVMAWDWRDLIDNRWEGNRLRAAWVGAVLGVGALLSTFWTVPFLLRRTYLTDMGWEKLHNYAELLFPGRIGDALSHGPSTVQGDMTWVIALAAIGVGTSIFFRRRFGIFLTLTGLVLVVAVVVTPQGRLWNARLLPFWYLCLYFLAALAVVELIGAVAVLVAKTDAAEPHRLTVIGGTVLASLVAFWAVALPLRVLPFGHESNDKATYSWLFVKTKDKHFVHDWATWNYSGYERKAAYPEYRAIIRLMDDLSKRNGCGRAMWEYDKSEDRFGTPMALMLLPYWTNHCVGSMEGLYFEASATTPYHFLNQSELSLSPSRAERDLPYANLNVSQGVDHLQLLGVKYYLAFSNEAVAQADADKDLTPLATTAEFTIPNTGQKVRWHVYEVAHSEVVQPLLYQPAVVKGWGKGSKDWQKMAVDWYVNRSRWNVMLADHGPKSWQRVRATRLPDHQLRVETPDKKKLSPTTVSHIKTGIDTISFHVDRPGAPVLVKSSYFPNWTVSGAEGPYRVAPNLMVVVPTKHIVKLHYGRTSVDWLAYLLTLIGIVLVVLLARARGLRIPPRAVRTPPLYPEPSFGEEELVTAGTGPSPGDRWAAPPEGPPPGS